MKTKDHLSFEITTWNAIRHQAKEINPEFAAIIDTLNPGKEFPLVKATYSFGDIIIKQGSLPLFTTEDTKAASLVSTSIKEALAYSPIPLALLLNKASEIYFTEENRIIPLRVFEPGQLFGTFETVDTLFQIPSHPLWNVSAGSRSIFTLPRIAEQGGLNRLKLQYGISSDSQGHTLSDHWHLFKQIAQHKNFTQPWESHILFFTQKWFKRKQDRRWKPFYEYLFFQAWSQSRKSLAKEQLGLLWRHLIKTITHRRIQPTPYLSDTLKHLILIANGEVPAFQPMTHSDTFAPVDGLQEALLNVYQVKKYAPTLLHAIEAQQKQQHPLYYSLAFPTLLEGSPESKYNSSTIMLDLRHLKRLIETLLHESELSSSVLKNKTFHYYHVEDDKFNEIKSSRFIPEEDSQFKKDLRSSLVFCATSPFWRGCVKITFK